MVPSLLRASWTERRCGHISSRTLRGFLDPVAAHVSMKYLMTCKGPFRCVQGRAGPGLVMGHGQEMRDRQK